MLVYQRVHFHGYPYFQTLPDIEYHGHATECALFPHATGCGGDTGGACTGTHAVVQGTLVF